MNLKNEPALALGLVEAALALAVTFGLSLSVEQVGAIMAVVAAATALLVRRQVSPLPRTATAATAAPPAAQMPSEPQEVLV